MFSYQTDNSLISNIGGWLGSYTAALVIYLFGSSAYMLVWMLLFLAYIRFMRLSYLSQIGRLIAFCVCIATCAGFCTRFSISWFGPDTKGGLIGHRVYSSMTHFCDEPIATLIIMALFLASLIIILRTLIAKFIQCCIWLHGWVLRHKDRFLATGRVIIYCLYILFYPVIKLFSYIYLMVTGLPISKSVGAMVYDQFHDASAEQINVQDHFWRAYLTEMATEIEQEKIPSCYEKKQKAIVHNIEYQDDLHSELKQEPQPYQLPPVSLLQPSKCCQTDKQEMGQLKDKAKLLEEKLAHFGITGTVVAIKRGPIVTLFEYQPDINARISKITALEDDLALALQAMSIRVIAPIPGTSFIGFEVANSIRATVSFGNCVQSSLFSSHQGALPLALGVDTVGNQLIVDLAKMPHLLIAGSTGSGKSVALHTMIISLLLKRTPEELKLILIDPKRLEFAAYNDCAHLVFPIVMQPKQTIPVLKWVVSQMEERYSIMTGAGARNILDYQSMAQHNKMFSPMPFMVVIIDELADLMMTCGRDIEDLIARIAQMARAAGIHMILATQRPSVDVITGLIKVNFPSRISCRVTSKVDSRTILDCNGAEKLLGRGDMLFLDVSDSNIKRVHGAYISDAEITAVVNHVRAQQLPNYMTFDNLVAGDPQLLRSADDQLYKEIVTFLKDVDEVSISLLQRKFKIGYNRSARIIDSLESQGLVMPSDGGKLRKVIHLS